MRYIIVYLTLLLLTIVSVTAANSEVILTQSTDKPTNHEYGSSALKEIGQGFSFPQGNKKVSNITWWSKTMSGSPSGKYWIRIESDNGTGYPDGVKYSEEASTVAYVGTSIGTGDKAVTFTFDPPVSLPSNTTLFWVGRTNETTAGYFEPRIATSNPYASGNGYNRQSGNPWTSQSTWDYYFIVYGITVASNPPDFNITTPANDSNQNDNFDLNISIINAATKPYTAAFAIDGTNITVTTINGTSYRFLVNTTNLTEGYNNLSVVLNNSDGTRAQSVMVFVDTVSPMINYATLIQQSDGSVFAINGSTIDENLYFNISVTDTNLYYFNISVCHNSSGVINFSDCEHKFKITGLNGTEYIYNGTETLTTFQDEGVHFFYYEIADGHTDDDIPPFDVETWPDYISFNGIPIHTLSAGNFTYTRLRDRYNFTLYLDTPIVELEIEVEDSRYDYRTNSPYLGHLIIDRYWLDFENTEGGTIDEIEHAPDKFKMKLNFDEPTDTIRFSSIGLINIYNRTDSAYIEAGADNVTTKEPRDVTYNVNGSGRLPYNVTFNYTPFYQQAPDNCTLILNTTSNRGFDATITKNVVNSFTVELESGLEGIKRTYDWYVFCDDEHLHPPSYTENHRETGLSWNVSIFNLATTTTTTTTTTTVFYTPTNNTAYLQDGVCPGLDTPSVLLFAFLFIALIIIYLFQILWLKVPIFGIVIGIAFLFFSWQFWACYLIMGWIMAAFGVMVMLSELAFTSNT